MHFVLRKGFTIIKSSLRYNYVSTLASTMRRDSRRRHVNKNEPRENPKAAQRNPSDPDRPRETRRGPEKPRRAQKRLERPRQAQRGPERPRERPREAQRGPVRPSEAQRPREAQRGPERPSRAPGRQRPNFFRFDNKSYKMLNTFWGPPSLPENRH